MLQEMVEERDSHLGNVSFALCHARVRGGRLVALLHKFCIAPKNSSPDESAPEERTAAEGQDIIRWQ